MINFKLDKRDAKIFRSILVDLKRNVSSVMKIKEENIVERVDTLIFYDNLENDLIRISYQVDTINKNKKSVRLRLSEPVIFLLSSLVLMDKMREMYDEANYYMNSDVIVKVFEGVEKYLRR